MIFRDRAHAADLLAESLSAWRGRHPLVIAIPRGAVPMGRIIARRLGGDLDVVLVRKLAAPGNPEFAIGAVDETGWTYLADFAREAGATPEYIAQQTARELATIRARRARYTPGRPPVDVTGRVVIVVDDGLATGATMLAAVHALRERGAARVICAVPVASREALAAVREQADEVVCLSAPAEFWAVGQAYLRFDQVDDDTVVAELAADASAGS